MGNINQYLMGFNNNIYTTGQYAIECIDTGDRVCFRLYHEAQFEEPRRFLSMNITLSTKVGMSSTTREMTTSRIMVHDTYPNTSDDVASAGTSFVASVAAKIALREMSTFICCSPHTQQPAAAVL